MLAIINKVLFSNFPYMSGQKKKILSLGRVYPRLEVMENIDCVCLSLVVPRKRLPSLRALALNLQDPGSVPSTHTVIHTICSYNSRGTFDPLLPTMGT